MHGGQVCPLADTRLLLRGDALLGEPAIGGVLGGQTYAPHAARGFIGQVEGAEEAAVLGDDGLVAGGVGDPGPRGDRVGPFGVEVRRVHRGVVVLAVQRQRIDRHPRRAGLGAAVEGGSKVAGNSLAVGSPPNPVESTRCKRLRRAETGIPVPPPTKMKIP